MHEPEKKIEGRRSKIKKIEYPNIFFNILID